MEQVTPLPVAAEVVEQATMPPTPTQQVPALPVVVMPPIQARQDLVAQQATPQSFRAPQEVPGRQATPAQPEPGAILATQAQQATPAQPEALVQQATLVMPRPSVPWTLSLVVPVVPQATQALVGQVVPQATLVTQAITETEEQEVLLLMVVAEVPVRLTLPGEMVVRQALLLVVRQPRVVVLGVPAPPTPKVLVEMPAPHQARQVVRVVVEALSHSAQMSISTVEAEAEAEEVAMVLVVQATPEQPGRQGMVVEQAVLVIQEAQVEQAEQAHSPTPITHSYPELLRVSQ